MATLNWQDMAAIATIAAIVLPFIGAGLMALGGWTVNWLTDCVGKRIEKVHKDHEERLIAAFVKSLKENIEPIEQKVERHEVKIAKNEIDILFLLRGGKVNGAAIGD